MRLIDADALIADCQLAQKQADRHGREFTNAFYSDGGEISTEWWCVEDMIENAPTIEPQRMRGKWTEKHHAYSDEESRIEEWQSCRCSKCGRYDTRPYLYYFSEPNYCSWCGADMRGEQE